MPKETFANHTPATLKNLAVQIRDSAVLIDAAADAMKTLHIEELTIGRRNAIEIGMASIDSFCAGLRETIRTAATKRVPHEDTATDAKGVKGRQRVGKSRAGDTEK